MKALVILAIVAWLSVLCIRGRLSVTSNPIGRLLLYLDMFSCAFFLGDADMTRLR